MTETERLQAVAAFYREQGEIHRVLAQRGARALAALADLFDGIAERHWEGPRNGWMDPACDHDDEDWPCPDVRAALAVAEALGIKETP